MTHTPLPWKFQMMGSEGGRLFPNTTDKRESLKFIAMVNGRDFATDQANGQFIERAVNAHYLLLEAAEAAEAALERLSTIPTFIEDRVAINKLKIAIAIAKTGQI